MPRLTIEYHCFGCRHFHFLVSCNVYYTCKVYLYQYQVIGTEYFIVGGQGTVYLSFFKLGKVWVQHIYKILDQLQYSTLYARKFGIINITARNTLNGSVAIPLILSVLCSDFSIRQCLRRFPVVNAVTCGWFLQQP